VKFLVDVGVGKSVEGWLQSKNYDTKSVRDINSKASDKEILNLAKSENRMIITMDKDFGELVYRSGLSHSGVLLLRLEDAQAEEKVQVIDTILQKYSEKLEGHFCVFQDGKLRIR
jgi:predicted nuclease of predicted toxin-antitoxin system